jgi:Legume-like lectin family
MVAVLKRICVLLLGLTATTTPANSQEDPDFAPHSDSLLHQLSFSAPFSEHDARGARILPWWQRSGESLLKQSFLRLTPDTRWTRGSAWSQNALGHAEFSVEWKFRISGLDEKEGGESMGLFITDRAFAEKGTVFGFTDRFVGLGVVVDTNRDDSNGRHRDISVVLNNGSKDGTRVLAEMTGCNANLRYWEGRDDFNVLKASRIRVKFRCVAPSFLMSSTTLFRAMRVGDLLLYCFLLY